MSEKSGFFNALRVDGEYDRKYNAEDYTDNLAVIISNGVLRSSADDLRVTANGLVPTVAAGRAWIKGHWYENTQPMQLAAVTAPVGGSRIDRIMLRFDNTIQQRKMKIVYVEGVASNTPVAPTPTRTDSVYDLVLADVQITANAVSISVVDKRSDTTLCGWVYSVSGDGSFFTTFDNSFAEWFEDKKDTLSSVTLFKRYSQNITLSSATSTVQFTIPQYDPDTCFVEVYVNGILDTRHSVSGNVITFTGSLIAGTVVTVNAYKSIDGTGIESVADEITELQNKVATLEGVSNYTYQCSGINDNISISQIARAFCEGSYVAADCTPAAAAFLQAIGGNTYLSSLSNFAQVQINVVGKMGVSTAASGNGTELSPYRWILTSSITTATNRKVVLDFANCELTQISCANNTYNTIFYGMQVNIKNANVKISGGATNCNVLMIECLNNGRNKVNVEGCYFEISGSGSVRIAEHGNFNNCDGYIVSTYGAAYCFKPKSATFIRIYGGSYFAYALAASGISPAIMHTSASEADAVCMAYNIHCPMVSKGGAYTQGFLSVANAGNTYINGVVSRLTSSGSYNDITGQINKNKG